MKILVYRNGELYLTVQVPPRPPHNTEECFLSRQFIINSTVMQTKNKLLRVLGSTSGIELFISAPSKMNPPEETEPSQPRGKHLKATSTRKAAFTPL